MPNSPRFHLDESITKRIAAGLRQRECECSSSPEEGLLGATDEEQLAFAIREGRVLITGDDDFLRMVSKRADHPGIVFWLQERHFGQLVRDLAKLRFEITAEEMIGQVVFFS